MRSLGVVVPDVLFEFFFELFFALEGCSFDEVVVERSPETSPLFRWFGDDRVWCSGV